MNIQVNHNLKHMYVKRYIDKMVFGEYQAVDEFRQVGKKGYRIHNGDVQIHFAGKWRKVEEYDEEQTNWQLEATAKHFQERGMMFGVSPVFQLLS